MSVTLAMVGDPSERQNPPVWEWLRRSRLMAVGWTAMRVWLGIMWIQAGDAEPWGSEDAGFSHHDGADGAIALYRRHHPTQHHVHAPWSHGTPVAHGAA